MSQISVAEYEIRDRTTEMSTSDTSTKVVDEVVPAVTAERETKQLPLFEFKSDQIAESDVNIQPAFTQFKTRTQYQNENAWKSLKQILPTTFDTRRTMVSSVRKSLRGQKSAREEEQNVEKGLACAADDH